MNFNAQFGNAEFAALELASSGSGGSVNGAVTFSGVGSLTAVGFAGEKVVGGAVFSGVGTFRPRPPNNIANRWIIHISPSSGLFSYEDEELVLLPATPEEDQRVKYDLLQKGDVLVPSGNGFVVAGT